MSRWGIIKKALRDRCKYHENWSWKPHWLGCWFYTLKAILCVALGRQKSVDVDPDAVDAVAMWGQRSWTSMDFMGEAQDWEELAVGHGVFRNWYYDTYTNSSA